MNSHPNQYRSAAHLFKTMAIASLLLAGLAGLSRAGIPIEPGLSGGWYDPARSGEGWQLEVLSDGVAVALWYTYPALDQDGAGEQLWVGGPGRIEGDRIIIDPALHFSGEGFGPDFDPTNVEQRVWGSMQFEFTGCDAGTVTWSGPHNYGSGVTPLQRLSGNPRMPCGLPPPDMPLEPDADDPRFPPPNAATPGLSGTWFDPSHSGEGWFLQEVAPGVVVIMWFTFDAEGNPNFLLGLSQLQGRSLVAPGVLRPVGSYFGPAFDPDDILRENWGDLHLVLDGCGSGSLSYRSPLPGFGAGLLHPQRLTQSQSLECGFPALQDLAAGSWTQSAGAPPLSEMPAAVLGGQIYVAGGFGPGGRQLWRFDPVLQTWAQRADLPQTRHHGQMAAFGDALYFFGGYISQMGLGFVVQSDAWRFDPAANTWTPIASLPIAKAAGSAVTLGDAIYLVGGEPHSALRYEPSEDRWTLLQIQDPWPRDHSTAVRYEDEIWILGGRSHDGPVHNNVVIYNPLTGVSRPGPAMRQGRSGFAATVLDGQIFAAGGEDLSGPVNLSGAEYYSPEHRAWRDAPSLPTAVHGVAAATANQHAWFLLGSVSPGGISNPGIVQAFRPPESD